MKELISMPSLQSIAPRSCVVLAVMIFALLISFASRAYFITHTPEKDEWIDLCIYVDGGQLVERGINPYDYTDGREERQRLRTDKIAYNPYVCSDQARWDYYASSNLPLSLLFYGVINKIAASNLVTWRWLLMACDCLLSLVIAYYVLCLWPDRGGLGKWIPALLLGALSPLLIAWGVVLPEDKGVQILLMLSAILLARSPSRGVRLFLAPLVLGSSISFKGLGVFIAPLCLYYALQVAAPLGRQNWRRIAFDACSFGGLTFLSCAFWFIPFGKGVIDMMVYRLQSNLGTAIGHGSMWRYFQHIYPESWAGIRITYLIAMAVIIAYGCWRKRFKLEIVTALLLLAFTIILLLNGSMDRMHIGIIVSLLLLGETWGGYIHTLLIYYVLGGLVILCNVFPPWNKFLYGIQFVDAEFPDALFCLGFVALVTLGCAYYSFWPKAVKDDRQDTGLGAINPTEKR